MEVFKTFALCLATVTLLGLVAKDYDDDEIVIIQDKKRVFPKGEDYSRYGENILMFKR